MFSKCHGYFFLVINAFLLERKKGLTRDVFMREENDAVCFACFDDLVSLVSFDRILFLLLSLKPYLSLVTGNLYAVRISCTVVRRTTRGR